MNRTLAAVALRALVAPGYETHKGYCARWVRQCDETACGDERHNDYWRTDDSPSAAKSAVAFRDAGLGFNYSGQSLQIGDILFKTLGSGGFGHVGIYTPRGVAENSSYQAARSGNGDARGLRSLAAFGAFQIVARLPDPRAVAPPVAPVIHAPRVWTFNDKPIPGARIDAGRLMAPVADVLHLLGLTIDASAVTAEGGNIRAWQEQSK